MKAEKSISSKMLTKAVLIYTLRMETTPKQIFSGIRRHIYGMMTETQRIFLIKKTILLLTILTVISLNLVSAINVITDIPKSMQSNQELEIVITAPERGDYDVKIFFEYQESNFPSEILTPEGWKSSRYYIQDINFEERSFNVRLQDPDAAQDSLSICIRMRKSDSTSTPQKQCFSIDIEKTSTESPEDSSEPPILSPIIYNEISPVVDINQTMTTEKEDIDNSPIYLSSSQREKTVYTSEGKSKIFINYFIALVVIIGIFLVIRSEIKNREI
jgi:hypothetical protein